MTAQAPTIHAHADFLRFACAAKSRYPQDVIIGCPQRGTRKLTYYVVNQAFRDLWLEGRTTLPNERQQ